MATPQTALIIDDHPLFRDALETALIQARGGAAQVVHAASIKEALDILETLKPDLILLDLHLEDAKGFDGLTRIQASQRACPIVVVSATEAVATYAKAKTLGASGYLPKSLGLDDLSAALVTVLDGGSWFPALDDLSESREATERVASLTPAQRRVINGLADGLLNKQIAYEMGISEATVKAHMTAIFRKLGANNRTQALLIYKSALGLEG